MEVRVRSAFEVNSRPGRPQAHAPAPSLAGCRLRLLKRGGGVRPWEPYRPEPLQGQLLTSPALGLPWKEENGTLTLFASYDGPVEEAATLKAKLRAKGWR